MLQPAAMVSLALLLVGCSGSREAGDGGGPDLCRMLDRALGVHPSTILTLPAELGSPGQGASEGTNRRWEACLAGEGKAPWRRLVPGDPPPDLHQVYAEPLVVLGAIAAEGTAAWWVPPGRPGAGLVPMGVTEVVVDRRAMGEPAMAFLDPILRRSLPPPSRDLVLEVDIHHLDSGAHGGAPPAARMFSTRDPVPPNWVGLEDWLATMEGGE